MVFNLGESAAARARTQPVTRYRVPEAYLRVVPKSTSVDRASLPKFDVAGVTPVPFAQEELDVAAVGGPERDLIR